MNTTNTNTNTAKKNVGRPKKEPMATITFRVPARLWGAFESKRPELLAIIERFLERNSS